MDLTYMDVNNNIWILSWINIYDDYLLRSLFKTIYWIPPLTIMIWLYDERRKMAPSRRWISSDYWNKLHCTKVLWYWHFANSFKWLVRNLRIPDVSNLLLLSSNSRKRFIPWWCPSSQRSLNTDLWKEELCEDYHYMQRYGTVYHSIG